MLVVRAVKATKSFFFSPFLVNFPVSLRLNRLFSENLSRLDSKDAELLRKEAADNVSWVFICCWVHILMVWLITVLFLVTVKRGVQADTSGAEGARYFIQVFYFSMQHSLFCFVVVVFFLNVSSFSKPVLK